MFNVLMMHVFNVNMMSEFSTGIYIVKKSKTKNCKTISTQCVVKVWLANKMKSN